MCKLVKRCGTRRPASTCLHQCGLMSASCNLVCCREKREREQELRDFDDLLRRRDDFKRRGPGGY